VTNTFRVSEKLCSLYFCALKVRNCGGIGLILTFFGRRVYGWLRILRVVRVLSLLLLIIVFGAYLYAGPPLVGTVLPVPEAHQLFRLDRVVQQPPPMQRPQNLGHRKQETPGHTTSSAFERGRQVEADHPS